MDTPHAHAEPDPMQMAFAAECWSKLLELVAAGATVSNENGFAVVLGGVTYSRGTPNRTVHVAHGIWQKQQHPGSR